MKIKNIANTLIIFSFIVLNSWGNEPEINKTNEKNPQSHILILSATKAEMAEIDKIIQNKKSISIEEHRKKDYHWESA
ncbi:adenosylhomocysteine nucleosidase [Borreliella japonica]|uniref:Adenosylhomocysteine nucleosidase n=1 Tax=Borreliella japonica TaxID=34095 RepID=A0A1G4Q6S3_BORJA|nr:hypothetical protein [Borreliella japonica]SCW40048.1 adenosylhomocysteine nucleosidase [Borreliella japonica]